MINHQSSIINHKSPIINHPSSITNHPSSIITHQSSIIHHQSSSTSSSFSSSSSSFSSLLPFLSFLQWKWKQACITIIVSIAITLTLSTLSCLLHHQLYYLSSEYLNFFKIEQTNICILSWIEYAIEILWCSSIITSEYYEVPILPFSNILIMNIIICQYCNKRHLHWSRINFMMRMIIMIILICSSN